jgi:hypothetical protein
MAVEVLVVMLAAAVAGQAKQRLMVLLQMEAKAAMVLFPLFLVWL